MDPQGHGAYINQRISETLTLSDRDCLKEMERIFSLPTPAREQAFVAFAMRKVEPKPRVKLTLIRTPNWHNSKKSDEIGTSEVNKSKQLYIRAVKSA